MKGCERPKAEGGKMKERAGNNFRISHRARVFVVGTLRVPSTSYGTRSVPTTLEEWHREVIPGPFPRRAREGVSDVAVRFSGKVVVVGLIDVDDMIDSIARSGFGTLKGESRRAGRWTGWARESNNFDATELQFLMNI